MEFGFRLNIAVKCILKIILIHFSESGTLRSRYFNIKIKSSMKIKIKRSVHTFKQSVQFLKLAVV